MCAFRKDQPTPHRAAVYLTQIRTQIPSESDPKSVPGTKYTLTIADASHKVACVVPMRCIMPERLPHAAENWSLKVRRSTISPQG